jgi:hypothetical protein
MAGPRRRAAELVRIVSVNDIYDISNLPRLAELLRHKFSKFFL